MNKKTLISLAAILVVLASLYFAQPQNNPLIDMNNTICPVSGHSVNGVDTHVYQGKKYNLCSDQCKESLSQNPEKYIWEE